MGVSQLEGVNDRICGETLATAVSRLVTTISTVLVGWLSSTTV